MKIEKITIYELLGLVKDGKAPEEIRYKNFVYGWVRKYKTYIRYDITGKALYITINNLNDYVEIIEETPKDKIVEIPKHIPNDVIQDLNRTVYPGDVKCIAHKINEIINYLQYKEKKEEQED